MVYGTIGGGQSNMLAGDFSFNVGMGLAVRNGEIAGRVKDVMIAGNFYRDSQSIAELSAEREPHGTAMLPYVLFGELAVSVKGG